MSILKSEIYLNDLIYVVENTNVLTKLKNKSVFVTGATGLIGSGIIDLLLMANSVKKLNIKVLVAARDTSKAEIRFSDFPDKTALKNISYVEYDATKSNSFTFYTDYIIHAASNAHPKAFVENPVDTMLSNIVGLKELLVYAKDNCVENVLYVSSSEVYGQKESIKPFEEEEYGYLDILNPRNAYASSKRASETLCASFYRQYGVKTNIVRPGHIYGPTASQNDSRVGSAFAYCAAEGKDIVLKSEGNQIRSYCYVLDCATAILTVMLVGDPAAAYNISNSDSIISIKELAQLYAEEGRVDLKFDLPTESEKAGFNPMDNSSLNSEKLEELGWKGLFDAKEGTSHTVAVLKTEY